MTSPSNIHSLHGQYFSAEICFKGTTGRVSVNSDGTMYLCQNGINGASELCGEMFGHTHAWYVGQIGDLHESVVLNLKILPSPIEYHALFQEILAKRGPTWSEDGSYSVIPNEVLAKIHSFMEGIKEFDAKNLGNNQNKSK